MHSLIKTTEMKVILLAGGRDFGRYPIAAQLPPALWPVFHQSAIARTIDCLKNYDHVDITACTNEEDGFFDPILKDENIRFHKEDLPVGTAGCVRDVVDPDFNGLILVIHANIVNLPDIRQLVDQHIVGRAELTVFLNPSPYKNTTAEIYLCNPSVLQHIPDQGYFDIKEGLLPEMLRKGEDIHTATLSEPVFHFRERIGYLRAILEILEKQQIPADANISFQPDDNVALWTEDQVTIDKNVQFFGPVYICKKTHIKQNTLIIGPAVIGSDNTIGENCSIAGSVLWDHVHINPDSTIIDSVIDTDTRVSYGGYIYAQEYTDNTKSAVSRSVHSMSESINRLAPARDFTFSALNQSKRNIILALCSILFILLIWSYWTTITELFNILKRSDEYSSGLLVPFIAAYILWTRRKALSTCPLIPSIFGVIVFVLAQGFRYFGVFFMYGSAERMSLVMSLIGLVWFLGGWTFLKRTLPVLLFLFLMIPVPRTIHGAIMLPLQRWATNSAVFLLQMVGYNVIQEGNIIHVNQNTAVAVAEACNGLRMIMAFFVISGMVVLLIRRPLWIKITLLISSIPIALLCNSIRLTITAIAFTFLKGEYWEQLFHDFGGYAMMPLALGMIIGELWLIQKIITPPQKLEPVVITRKQNVHV